MARIIKESNSNPYKSFRSPFPRTYPDLRNVGAIQKRFDEPTYLTFKLNFDYENVKTDNTDFDKLPMPLFNTYDADIEERNEYSTVQYLKDMDENIRAAMMEKFIQEWNNLQDNYQWYFQSISGLDSILSVNPETGQRVPSEGRIEFTMLEAIDLRVTHLLDTYRKIAWDDTYQRWILPDIMRHFKLEIYVTEFRSFHQPSIGSRQNPGDLFQPVILQLAEAFTPVYVIELERCEFDITSIRKIPDSLTVNEAQMREFTFSIKVGNLRERYINPILNYYYYDVILNGFDRSYNWNEDVEFDFETGEFDRPIELNWPTDLDAATNPKITPGLSTFAKGNALAQSDHKTGDPFLESGANSNIPNSVPPWARNNYNTFNDVNPTDPATWAGNALTLGKAFVENFVEQQIDKATTQKIPGLGISFNEGLAALQSKNVFTLFGAARKAISENVKGTLPSQELEDNFIDTQLAEFLQGIAQSEATNDEAIELQEAANVALNDQGTWEKIRDYSKATDLLSQALGELNIQNTIENPNALKNQYLSQQQVNNKISDPLVYEGPPSSATEPKSVEGGKGQTSELGSTDGQLSPGSQIAASEQLGEDAGESLERPEDGLGSNAGGRGPTAIPSEQLGEDAGESLSRPSDGLGSDAGSSGKTAEPSEQLGEDAGASPIAQPEDGLGNNAGGSGITAEPSEQLGGNAGGRGSTTTPSANLGKKAEGGLSQGDIGLGEQIEGKGLSVPKPGEATDGDPIQNKPLPQPPPSRATNNDIE